MGEFVLDIAIESTLRGEAPKLRQALDALTSVNPDVGYRTNDDGDQFILSADGELQLDRAVEALKREYGIAVRFSVPQVAYREAISRMIEHEYTYRKQSSGLRRFARIKFRIEPNEPGAGFAFRSLVLAGHVPEEYVPSVQKGVESIMSSGPIIGCPIVDVKFTLIDGAYHDVDSSILAFEMVGRAGVREAIERAGPKVIEPIMRAEVTAPFAMLGDVIGDLNTRRARIEEAAGRAGGPSVIALVPMANMFGYVNSLRSITSGAGRFEMRFSHYAEVPARPDPDDRFRPAMAMRA